MTKGKLISGVKYPGIRGGMVEEKLVRFEDGRLAVEVKSTDGMWKLFPMDEKGATNWLRNKLHRIGGC